MKTIVKNKKWILAPALAVLVFTMLLGAAPSVLPQTAEAQEICRDPFNGEVVPCVGTQPEYESAFVGPGGVSPTPSENQYDYGGAAYADQVDPYYDEQQGYDAYGEQGYGQAYDQYGEQYADQAYDAGYDAYGQQDQYYQGGDGYEYDEGGYDDYSNLPPPPPAY